MIVLLVDLWPEINIAACVCAFKTRSFRLESEHSAVWKPKDNNWAERLTHFCDVRKMKRVQLSLLFISRWDPEVLFAVHFRSDLFFFCLQTQIRDGYA